jgi:hypothetical protein
MYAVRREYVAALVGNCFKGMRWITGACKVDDMTYCTP